MRVLRRISVLFALITLGLPIVIQGQRWGEPPGRKYDIATSRQLSVGGATLQVDVAAGAIDLSVETLIQHVQAAASAVTAYYGRFPVSRARVLIVPVAGRDGVFGGTTWGDMGGWPAFTRIHIGQHTTNAELADDWMMTHELVHTAFPDLPEDQHWMEEGLATYIEPIARVMTGELQARQVWRDMVRDMPKGEPGPGDEGLDRTHTWGRTYWGGALFCLVADVNIRKETNNRKGLRDALRAIVAEGGTINHDWDLPKALAIGDHATGTHVLTNLYSTWKDSPSPVDLEKMWNELGIRSGPDGIEFVSTAPLAAVRDAITRGESKGQAAAVAAY
jgi:hypothetical protein